MRPDLYRMFFPLGQLERSDWASIVRLPEAEYAARLADKARDSQCRQEARGEGIAWVGRAGNTELLWFRIPDPSDLGAIRRMYESLGGGNCPLAYAFVNQRGDGADTWDVFQMSRLSYLCHCNRLSGPGADCPN